MFEFRAWGKHSHQDGKFSMYYPADSTPFNDSEGCSPTDVMEVLQRNYGWIFMPYIGCRDFNNKKIYAGDILDISSSYWSGEHYAIVRFDDFVQGVQLEHTVKAIGRQWWGDKKHQHQYKIVGNVYQNPELLEKYK